MAPENPRSSENKDQVPLLEAEKSAACKECCNEIKGLNAQICIDQYLQDPSRIETNQEAFDSIEASAFLERTPEELQTLFLKEGVVNFYERNALYQALGAGDLYPSDQTYLKIDGVVGKGRRALLEKWDISIKMESICL